MVLDFSLFIIFVTIVAKLFNVIMFALNVGLLF